MAEPGAEPDTSGPTITLDDPSGVERILVVTAHPDDVDFGVAGSVASWVKSGIDVRYCIVTDGDAGGSDRTISRPEMAVIRRREQQAAAAEVGVTDVTFLGYPDGRLVPSIELRRDISRQIRIHKPERLVCQSPERMWDRIGASHPDHLAAGEAAVCAVYPDARNPFAHPELLEEGLEPYSVAELWMMAAPGTNRVVDVTDTFDRKVAALLSHRSQVGDAEGLDARLRQWLTAGAVAAGLAPGRLAESFQVVLTP
jgi:LmbE family N-acetylglucosaminyl deacetylase